MNDNIKKYLLLGIIGGILTMIGDSLLMTVLQEQGGYVVPSMVVFLVFYLMSAVTMILLIAKKKTPLPAWMWIFNPLTFKLLFNALGRLGGGSAVMNGILCSNMSLGAIILFAAWWFVLKEEKNHEIS